MGGQERQPTGRLPRQDGHPRRQEAQRADLEEDAPRQAIPQGPRLGGLEARHRHLSVAEAKGCRSQEEGRQEGISFSGFKITTITMGTCSTLSSILTGKLK